jgi:energy-coupling factor transporter ATP-binding protein EcfA2
MKEFGNLQLERIAPFFRHTEELTKLIEYTADRFRPVMVTGPVGIGKTTLVQFFVTEYLPPRTEVEWVDLESTSDPSAAVRLALQRIRQSKLRNRVVVVLNGVDVFSAKQLEETFNQFYNWKIVSNVIAIGQARKKLRRTSEIHLTLPSGKLYGLKDQTPSRRILETVAPRIITANDDLIMNLKRQPGDLYKISPRKFEEVIADLLTDMGMEVELTPATRDGGKDILAYMNTELGRFLTLVEAKQHNKSRPVGVSLVRSLYGTLIDHQATSGMLVTTSRFANPAKQFQERHKYQLSLRDYQDVVSWILKYKS